METRDARDDETLYELKIHNDLVSKYPYLADVAVEISAWAWNLVKDAVAGEKRRLIGLQCPACSRNVALERALVGEDHVEMWVHLLDDGRWVTCEAHRIRGLSDKEER